MITRPLPRLAVLVLATFPPLAYGESAFDELKGAAGAEAAAQPPALPAAEAGGGGAPGPQTDFSLNVEVLARLRKKGVVFVGPMKLSFLENLKGAPNYRALTSEEAFARLQDIHREFAEAVLPDAKVPEAYADAFFRVRGLRDLAALAALYLDFRYFPEMKGLVELHRAGFTFEHPESDHGSAPVTADPYSLYSYLMEPVHFASAVTGRPKDWPRHVYVTDPKTASPRWYATSLADLNELARLAPYTACVGSLAQNGAVHVRVALREELRWGSLSAWAKATQPADVAALCP